MSNVLRWFLGSSKASQSFTLVLDGVVRSEEYSVALAKALSACFMLRGAQLAIVRRLDSQFVVEIHTTLLSWIGKYLAASEASKNKKLRNRAVTFFRVLQPLLSSVDSRDSLKMWVLHQCYYNMF